MGTALGDALARKGLVDQKRADEEAVKVREKKEQHQREAKEAEQRALRERGDLDRSLPPPEWED